MLSIRRLLFGALFIAIGSGAITAATASTDTPPSSAGTHNSVITANDLKPSSCAGITLNSVVAGSGIITGTDDSELITGSAFMDAIVGLGGDDCILAGGAIDSLAGGDGTDVCDGGGQVGDTFATCETVIP